MLEDKMEITKEKEDKMSSYFKNTEKTLNYGRKNYVFSHIMKAIVRRAKMAGKDFESLLAIYLTVKGAEWTENIKGEGK